MELTWYYFVLVTLISCLQQTECSTVVVDTNVGKIAGNTLPVMVDGVSKIITTFTNIPFAETTAGKNRFLKPIPKAPFKDTFQANGIPVGCYQSSKAGAQRHSQYANFTEDCLILNVYVPHDFTQNVSLPVMIWILGGGFTEGVTATYNPSMLVGFTDVIVVTISYRLGMFGFLRSSDGQLPGNQGLWDQHLAIKWVHENIVPFTGNQNKITIFGESAGGISVLFQALYPGNKGYFQRVIAESGSPMAKWGFDTLPNAAEYIKLIGCDSSRDPLACLLAKTPEQLQIPSNPIVQFVPVVDGDFIPETTEQILFGNTSNAKSIAAREFYSSLDILSGVNNYDGILYLMYVWPGALNYSDVNHPMITRKQLETVVFGGLVNSIFHPKDNKTAELLKQLVTFEYTNWSDPDSFLSTRESTVTISNDVAFFSPAIRLAQAHASTDGGNTYFYEFSFILPKSTSPLPSWIHGANHYDEVALVLGQPLSNSSNSTEAEKYVSRAMTTMWSNFAKSGNPNTPVDVSKYIHTTWPDYNMMSQYYFEISDHMWVTSVKQRFHAKRMDFWSELGPKIAGRL